MQTEKVKITTEYIKLDQLLKFLGVAEKRQENSSGRRSYCEF